mgnify:CR=1 FL=1
MNRRMVLYVVGTVIKIEAALMLLPLITSLIYKESCINAILISIGIALVSGFALTLIFKPGSKVIYAKEGFVIGLAATATLTLAVDTPPKTEAARDKLRAQTVRAAFEGK